QVLAVNLVQVDVVGTEPPQARVAGLADVLARGALGVRSRADGHSALGGDDELRAPTPHRLAADRLRHGAGVGVGGVEEVAASVEEPIDDAQRLGLVTAPAGHAEGHGAEAQFGDAEAAAAEGADAHRESIAERLCRGESSWRGLWPSGGPAHA